jgi:hypothetical protein
MLTSEVCARCRHADAGKAGIEHPLDVLLVGEGEAMRRRRHHRHPHQHAERVDLAGVIGEVVGEHETTVGTQ